MRMADGMDDDERSVDRRLVVLETRFDTILPTLATKADLDRLQAGSALHATELRGEYKEGMAGLRAEFKQGMAELEQGMAELRAEFKQDLAELRAEFKQNMAELRAEFKQDMAELRAEFKQGMAELRAEFKQDMARMYKWIAATCLTLILGFSGTAVMLFGPLNARSERVEAHLQQLDARSGRVEAHLQQLDAQYQHLDGRFERLEKLIVAQQRR